MGKPHRMPSFVMLLCTVYLILQKSQPLVFVSIPIQSVVCICRLFWQHVGNVFRKFQDEGRNEPELAKRLLKYFFQILFCGLTIQILLGLQTMEDRMPNLRANVFHQKCSVDRQTLFL